MLSFLVALLQTDPQTHKTEGQLEARAKEVFEVADSDHNGKLTKQEIYNYFADVRVNMSHYTVERLFKQLSGGAQMITLQQFLQGLERYHKMLLTDFETGLAHHNTKPCNGYGRKPSRNSNQQRQSVKFSSNQISKTLPADTRLARSTLADKVPDPSNMILNKPASAMSMTTRSATQIASQTDRTGQTSVLDDSDMHHTSKRDQTMSRLAATRQLERELAERSERIRIRNLQKAMEPVKEVLAMIDESGIGKMSYHDFYFFLERTNPHMLPAASSIFFTLDRCMNGEVRFKDILRVLYPHAYESELTEMLRLVTKKRQVKGEGSVHHQLAELRDIFAVYDEDGSGQLDQKEFLEALMAAGFELAEAQHMFNIIDSDHGGTVSLEEFADWYLHHAPAKHQSIGILAD